MKDKIPKIHSGGFVDKLVKMNAHKTLKDIMKRCNHSENEFCFFCIPRNKKTKVSTNIKGTEIYAKNKVIKNIEKELRRMSLRRW